MRRCSHGWAGAMSAGTTAGGPGLGEAAHPTGVRDPGTLEDGDRPADRAARGAPAGENAVADALRDDRPRRGDPGRQHRGAGSRRAPGTREGQGGPSSHPSPRRCPRGPHPGEVYWDAGTARLLPRLIKGRTRGPVFVTHRKPGPGKVVSPRDNCPDSGLARLSYGQARMLLDERTALGGEPGTGWDLHEWRHSSLTRLGEGGASLLMLMAKSRHKKAEKVRKYFHPSPETIPEVAGLLAPGDRRRRPRAGCIPGIGGRRDSRCR